MNLMAFFVFVVTVSQILSSRSSALDVHRLRQVTAESNVTSILVFGDSSVDPGNNNFLGTTMKANYPPYGQTFFGRKSTGRFCDGRLATDFIAEALGFMKAIPAFLDPNVTRADLMHGISFASAASGYDDLTANLSKVWSFSKQMNYFRHYKIHLNKLVGPLETKKIINNAIFILSMGTNDFIQNYFLEDIRPKQFSLPQYLRLLSSRMFNDAMMLKRQGARRLVVVGVPPLGCMPLVRTLRGQNTCVEQLNKVVSNFNSMIVKNLAILGSRFALKTAYIDSYASITYVIRNPKKYGITEISRGCCGTGTFEFAETCKGLPTCKNPSQYIFWDAVHPTQRMYQIIAEKAIQSIIEDFFF